VTSIRLDLLCSVRGEIMTATQSISVSADHIGAHDHPMLTPCIQDQLDPDGFAVLHRMDWFQPHADAVVLPLPAQYHSKAILFDPNKDIDNAKLNSTLGKYHSSLLAHVAQTPHGKLYWAFSYRKGRHYIQEVRQNQITYWFNHRVAYCRISPSTINLMHRKGGLDVKVTQHILEHVVV
jgi:hypothetical protein